jgi:RNAse (barnase) inhibitor barstar
MFMRGAGVLKIDVSAVSDAKALRLLLEEPFEFPDYYGRNWDSFDECIRDAAVPDRVAVVGMSSLEEKLPREARLFRDCARTFEAKQPGHRFEFDDC